MQVVPEVHQVGQAPGIGLGLLLKLPTSTITHHAILVVQRLVFTAELLAYTRTIAPFWAAIHKPLTVRQFLDRHGYTGLTWPASGAVCSIINHSVYFMNRG
ncbi:hypothetical protein D3C77_342830 [compost metagenome]